MNITNEQIVEAKTALLALAPKLARTAAPIFKELDYVWHKDGRDYVPDSSDIERTLKYLIGELNSDLLSLETGRLVAEIREDEAYIRMEISEAYIY